MFIVGPDKMHEVLLGMHSFLRGVFFLFCMWYYTMHMYPLANVTRPHSMHTIDVAFGYRSTDRMAWQAYTLVWL